MATRVVLASRNTNVARQPTALLRAGCVDEALLSVRQTGAVQGQREKSSTEPHTKKMGLIRRARDEGKLPPVLFIQFWGRGWSQEGVWLHKNWRQIRRPVRDCLRPHG